MATLRIYDVIADKSNTRNFSIYVITLLTSLKYKITKIIQYLNKNQKVLFVIANKLHFGHRIHDPLNKSTTQTGCNVMELLHILCRFKRELY
jgi:hypothetical protein